jgi:hypothetical protein
MTDDPMILQTRDLQRRVFRVACDPLRYGLTLKAISLDSGIPDSTLRTYASGSACMPLSALRRLFGVLPIELLSALVPDGWCIAATNAPDHDDLAATCIDFAGAHARARHPESEAGVYIGPSEQRELDGKATRLKGVA